VEGTRSFLLLEMPLKRALGPLLSLSLATTILTATAYADEVSDWNRIMVAALAAENVGGIVATRHAAIVQSAVYDAVNGIERRYKPIHVATSAPRGASSRAAVVQAAYATLLKTDGNAATAADPEWVSLIPTPPYLDYPSGIVGVASAAATVLASVFGSNVALAIESSTTPGVTRSFADFGTAVDEIVDARVFGGIHFRFADTDARQLGTSVGKCVVANSFGAF
jgi:hypothetical protein